MTFVGRLLVSAGEDGGSDLYDIRGERLLQTLDVHHGEVRCARLCPPATHLMSGTQRHLLLNIDTFYSISSWL